MPERLIYKSKWVVADPWTVLENGYVQMVGENIEAVGTGKPQDPGQVHDLGPGALVAPMVNAHTHLELSALKGAVALDVGFQKWVSELLRIRNSLTEIELLSGAADGVLELDRAGCRIVAEVSTLGITRQLFRSSPLSGIFFHEHLGSGNPEISEVHPSSSFRSSLAAHAPHTTSPELLRSIKTMTLSRNLPMSVHLAESEDEWRFITAVRGAWADFLTERNIDFSNWPLPAKSPVDYLDTLGVLDSKTLAVHLIHCSSEDLELLRSSDTKVCFCPRSNFLLHQKLPDIPRFLASGFKPCLGTDSLASTPSLSILDEMTFIASKYDSISPVEILAMGTLYGAAAINMDKKCGRLAPDFKGVPHFVPIQAGKSSDVLPAIVSSGNAEINQAQRGATGT